MTDLYTWARDWSIPYAAVQDLQCRFGATAPEPGAVVPGRSEASVASEAVLRARRDHGAYLWRNNSGAYSEQQPPSPGTRWGLGNTSKAINEVFKSPDHVGIYPRLIVAADVGSTIGQFWGLEEKKSDWSYSGTKRELAQLNFGKLVLSLGGRWSFYTGGELP